MTNGTKTYRVLFFILIVVSLVFSSIMCVGWDWDYDADETDTGNTAGESIEQTVNAGNATATYGAEEFQEQLKALKTPQPESP